MNIDFRSKKLVLMLLVVVSLFSVGCLSYAAEQEVAGAGPYSEPTLTPTPTSTPMQTLTVSPVPTPLIPLSPVPSPSVAPVSGGGFLEWLMDPANLLWIGLGIAALAIIAISIYLSRKKRSQSPV